MGNLTGVSTRKDKDMGSLANIPKEKHQALSHRVKVLEGGPEDIEASLTAFIASMPHDYIIESITPNVTPIIEVNRLTQGVDYNMRITLIIIYVQI